MNKFLQGLGRVAHVVIQVGGITGQAIALTNNGGKINWINVAIAAAQIYAADQARQAPAPDQKPTQEVKQ